MKNFFVGLAGLIFIIFLLGWIITGINSCGSSELTDSRSKIADETPTSPAMTTPSSYPFAADVADPMKRILVDASSLDVLASDFGMVPQPNTDGGFDPRENGSGWYIDDRGKRYKKKCPLIRSWRAKDMQHLKGVDIFVDGPLGWPRTPDKLGVAGPWPFPISALDWHDDVMVRSIRLCCGGDVLNHLTTQIDAYLAAHGADTIMWDMNFTQGGYSFNYDFHRVAHAPTFSLSIRGVDSSDQ